MKSSGVLWLFIAIDLSDEITKSFRDPVLPKIRWVKPQNLYLPLKFLRDTLKRLSHSINSSVRVVTDGVSPFVLQIHGLGAFSYLRVPRTLWLGIHGIFNHWFK
jgi:2'-5' RNA ligase